MSSIKIEHTRDAFDFLLFLANIGGVQLVLNLLCNKILSKSQKNESLYDTLKKFFHVRATDQEFLGHAHDKEHHYHFKLSKDFKIMMSVMNSMCCVLCKRHSKDHVMLDRIHDKGEKLMKQHINAEFVFETLQEH